MHPLEQLRDDALREIESARDEQALETARVKYLGRSGSVSAWGEQMKTLASEEKPIVGKLLNEVRSSVTAAIDLRAQQFRSQKESDALTKIDISLPGTQHEIGALHPLTQMLEPPIRVIAPGAAYRRDEVDATHSAQFHQIEGLYVDKNVSVADLKGTLEFFMRELFGADTAVQFRPHYFPFTEPSLEIYVKSKALKKGEEWVEVCGCGVVHPAVFEAVNKARGDKAYDPEKWSGYAFGLGMDRLAMILFDIPDIRLFAQNDLRFLKQFA